MVALLLGSSREQLLDRLLPIAGGPDLLERAGTRHWAALEAARKAGAGAGLELELERVDGDSVVFRGGACVVCVCYVPRAWTRGPERVVVGLSRPAVEQVGVSEPAADSA